MEFLEMPPSNSRASSIEYRSFELIDGSVGPVKRTMDAL
jgi:hypothetical protein